MSDNEAPKDDQNPSGEGVSNEGERFVVRCRGLPWSCTTEEIITFFDGCGLATPDEPSECVHMTLNREGRPSGEAYVEQLPKKTLIKLSKGTGKTWERDTLKYSRASTARWNGF